MNVLITGGAGFIGSHTADALLAEGHRVRLADCLDPQIHGSDARFPSYLDERVKCLRLDLRTSKGLQDALEGIDAVFHFAACTGVGQSMYDWDNYVSTNCGATAVLIEALIKRKHPLKRLVLASSRAVYGEGTHRCPEHGMQYPQMRLRHDLEAGRFGVPCPVCSTTMRAMPTQEERILMPGSLYAWTKKHQEDQCRFAASAFGLPVTILRYFNVFGSRQSLKNPYTGVVSIFYSRIQAGKPISLYENGTPLRDFVHVSDVARANCLAMNADVPPGSCFNVGSGHAYTIKEVAEALGAACGKPALLQDLGEFRVGDIHACHADLNHSQQGLGYKPCTGLEEGMAEFAAWARGEESVDRYASSVSELRNHGLFGRVLEKSS